VRISHAPLFIIRNIIAAKYLHDYKTIVSSSPTMSLSFLKARGPLTSYDGLAYINILTASIILYFSFGWSVQMSQTLKCSKSTCFLCTVQKWYLLSRTVVLPRLMAVRTHGMFGMSLYSMPPMLKVRHASAGSMTSCSSRRLLLLPLLGPPVDLMSDELSDPLTAGITQSFTKWSLKWSFTGCECSSS